MTDQLDMLVAKDLAAKTATLDARTTELRESVKKLNEIVGRLQRANTTLLHLMQRQARRISDLEHAQKVNGQYGPLTEEEWLDNFKG